MTWKDSLKAAFKDVDSVDDIDLDKWEDLLSDAGIEVHENVKESFEASEEAEKKEVLEILWGMAHEEELSLQERVALVEKMANRHARRAVGPEPPDSVGW